MAQQNNDIQDGWSDGMTQFREAMEHNLTASRLLTTGAIAVGAAATAYFWDPDRRAAFLESTRRWSSDLNSWWSGLYSGSTGGSEDRSSGRAS